MPKSVPIPKRVTVKVTPAGLVIHNASMCKGQPCPFHKPSHHHMVNWPINVRLDRGALCERICPHGVGHPDPDSLAYFARRQQAGFRGDNGVHGCCGCCASPSKP
jgi:hypothetical protein